MKYHLLASTILTLILGPSLSSCSGEPPTRLLRAKGSGDVAANGQNPAQPGSGGSGGGGGGTIGEPNPVDPEIGSPTVPNKDPEVLPELPKPINETGGSDDNDAVAIPMPAGDTGSQIDPYLAPRMIMSANTKQCLDLDGNTNRNSEVIQGRPCAGSTGQMIEIKKQAGGHVTLSFLGSKGCWKLRNGSFEKRTILEQWKCDGSDAQKWKLVSVGDNSYAIKPAADKANHCVDMDTNGPTVRSTLQIYDCLNNPQQTWVLVRKDKNFVPKPQPVLSLDDICSHKIRVYENDTSAAGKLVYETLGGRLMDRVPEVAREVCKILYKKPSDVIANINYMTVFVESNLPGGIAAEAKPNGYKDSVMKFSAKHFQEKKNAGYDIAKYLKGTMAFELTHVFQYPLNSMADEKVKSLHAALPFAIRMKANYSDPNWKRDRSGTWDEGGLQTGYFMAYLENRVPGFLNKLNSLMSSAKDESIVMQAAGKSVDELWDGYVADPNCSGSNVNCGK